MVYKIFFILLIFGLLIAIDMPKLIKEKKKRVIIVYSAFILLGFIITFMDQVMEFSLSSVTHWLIKIYT